MRRASSRKPSTRPGPERWTEHRDEGRPGWLEDVLLAPSLTPLATGEVLTRRDAHKCRQTLRPHGWLWVCSLAECRCRPLCPGSVLITLAAACLDRVADPLRPGCATAEASAPTDSSLPRATRIRPDGQAQKSHQRSLIRPTGRSAAPLRRASASRFMTKEPAPLLRHRLFRPNRALVDGEPRSASPRACWSRMSPTTSLCAERRRQGRRRARRVAGERLRVGR
jgi:hypothetical protein